ncbi:MAG TPA: hypothetical protein VMZ91_09345 [Candidatus Paceibacterota bacterium]|nr:hypothetical protein [Candidatus Paceibacterota bacterium]
MKKSFILELEKVARKHEKGTIGRSRNCFKAGAEFCDKKSEKQFSKADMFQMLSEGVLNFAEKNKIKVSNSEIKTWFKKYINK